jgi:AraC-binding-like domain
VHANLAAFEISTVRAVGQRNRRTPQLIQQAGEEYLFAGIQLKGQGRVERDGRVAVLDRGSMAFYDSSRPGTVRFDDAFEHVVVKVPLSEMLAETGLRSTGGVTATTLASQSPAGVIAQFFHGLSKCMRLTPRRRWHWRHTDAV